MSTVLLRQAPAREPANRPAQSQESSPPWMGACSIADRDKCLADDAEAWISVCGILICVVVAGALIMAVVVAAIVAIS